MTNMLQVIDLVAGYQKPVIGPISINIEPGQIVGITGPNGSGKTTLLNAITGYATIFGGEIKKKPSLRIMHQRQRPVRSDDIPLLVSEFLELTKSSYNTPNYLEPLLKKPIRILSEGQYNFMHMWSCIGSDTELILLDEPSDNLDKEGLKVLFDTLTSVPEKRAFLIISHERSLLETTCNTVLEI